MRRNAALPEVFATLLPSSQAVPPASYLAKMSWIRGRSQASSSARVSSTQSAM